MPAFGQHLRGDPFTVLAGDFHMAAVVKCRHRVGVGAVCVRQWVDRFGAEKPMKSYLLFAQRASGLVGFLALCMTISNAGAADDPLRSRNDGAAKTATDPVSEIGMAAVGHEERFPPLRLSAGFSIAANVKPRLDHLIPPPSWARLTCHTGLSLLFEVGVRPPHDGMRRMGRPNLWGALAAD